MPGTTPGATGSGSQVSQAAQPPSFTAAPTLPALKGQARPITSEERRARIGRARALTVREDLGAIILTGDTSLVYFTNFRWGQSERMFAVTLPAKGTQVIVCRRGTEPGS